MKKTTALLGLLAVTVATSTAAIAATGEREFDPSSLQEQSAERNPDAYRAAQEDVDRECPEEMWADEISDTAFRISGQNRYATAAAISCNSWHFDDAPIVFLATGEGYADALAMGPSTFISGPLLLTQRDTLPPATRAELERLEPCAVVAVGGAMAISESVITQADAYTDDECVFNYE